MDTAATSFRRPNQGNTEITTDTKALSIWVRYVNGIVLAAVWTLFAGEHNIPARSVAPAEWHRFLWIVCVAIGALLLDRAQAINNLIAHLRKQRHIERGLVSGIVFGRYEFQPRLSWALFYAKLILTLFNVAGCLWILGHIVARWVPNLG
jgi:hypothetical protein